MVVVAPAYPDQQVVLKFYGELQGQTLAVELKIFRRGDRNHIQAERFFDLNPNPALATQGSQHWQHQYRPLFRGRALKPQTITADNPNRQACHASARQLATTLNQWLNQSQFQDLRETLLQTLNVDRCIQVLIQTEDIAITQLPWSEWQLLKSYPHLSVDYSSVAAPPPQTQQGRSRVRILGIFGASQGIALETDQHLLTALEQTTESVEVCLLQQPQRHELNDQLWEQAWDIIIFAGHGAIDAQGQGVLRLNNQGEQLGLNDICYGLRKAVSQGLQLAIFNSCDGLGLLTRHQQEPIQIPQLVVMRNVVPDRVAQAFLGYLLTAFTAGEPLYLAVKTARERLQGLEQDYPCASWLPILWQNPHIVSCQLATLPPASSPQSLHYTPKRFWRPTWRSLIITMVVATLAIALGRAPLAIWLLQQGNMAWQEQRELITAERYYQIAKAIAPRNPNAYYALALLYDTEWGDSDKALKLYEQSARLGLPESIAEYVRLRLLNDASSLSEADYSQLLKLTHHCIETTSRVGTQASCLKNKGWTRSQQQRWPEAEAELKTALNILQNSSIQNKQSPHTHCLLAQALEAQDKFTEARKHWQAARLQSRETVQEQDHCLGLLAQRQK